MRLRQSIYSVVVCILLTFAAAQAEQRSLTARPKAPTGEMTRGELWLLTIGIDTYLQWPRLKTAVNDAKAIKTILLDRYHLSPLHVIELYDEQATRKNILASFRALTKKVRSEDSLVIFYAGHGHLDSITKKGSWIPVESGIDDSSAWIANNDIKDYLNIDAIKAKHILLVSDSCFAGDFFRGTRGIPSEISDTVIKKAWQRSSRLAITSGGVEPVLDSGFGGNSVFSHFFVNALKNNSSAYLIPSELFMSIKGGVAKNAEQLPQFGSLYGVGGQEGGELVLFLKKEDPIAHLSATSAARQKELEQLQKAEAGANVARQREEAAIRKKQAEIDSLDKQIAEMKTRLGSGAVRNGDSLDQIMAMAEKKEQQGHRLEVLRQQRESEELKRRHSLEQLKQEALRKKSIKVHADLAKYQKIASSKYAQDMKGAAWEALIKDYPEAKGVSPGDETAFLAALGLSQDGRNIVTEFDKQRQDLIYTDPQTGLQWLRNGNFAGKGMTWQQATDWVKTLTIGGYKDWRMPSKEEFEAYTKRGGSRPATWFNANGFNNVQPYYYWTGSSYPTNTGYAWSLYLHSNYTNYYYKTYSYYVWPVRMKR